MSKMNKSLLNFGLNILLSKINTQEAKPEASTIPELGDVSPVLSLRQKEGAVVVVLGRRGSGKTILCQRLAEIIGRPVYAVSPEETPPKWITELQPTQLEELPPTWSTLYLDDIPSYMSSRDYSDIFVRQVETMIPMVRHRRKLILIFAAQLASQADKYVLDADLVILKAPSILYADVERAGVKKLQDRAMQHWKGRTDRWLQRHCYIVSHLGEGLVRVNLPKVQVGVEANHNMAQG